MDRQSSDDAFDPRSCRVIFLRIVFRNDGFRYAKSCEGFVEQTSSGIGCMDPPRPGNTASHRQVRRS